MAGHRKKREKQLQRRQLLIGIGVLSLVLLLLLAAALAAGGKPAPEASGQAPRLEPNPYGPGDFQSSGGFLTCLSGKAVAGIDVSAHQQVIDWQAVADSGVEFAMIRVGYRGYQTGIIHPDDYALQNYRGAKAAGLKVGVYFFSQAVSMEETLEEARWVLDAIHGWELDMPVVFDWEYVSESARTAHVTADQLTFYTGLFCSIMQTEGYQPMVYFNRHQAEDLLRLEALCQYPFWLAMYQTEMDYPYQVEMWQYSSTGTVPGITGSVDLNLWFPEG